MRWRTDGQCRNDVAAQWDESGQLIVRADCGCAITDGSAHNGGLAGDIIPLR